jgi:hypothetical protein
MRLLGSEEAAARLQRGQSGSAVAKALRGQLRTFRRVRARHLLYR